MNVRRIWIALFCLAICTVGLADTLKLKDGTVLEGKVQEVGDKYWIKLANGQTRMVNKSEVVSKTIGDVKPATPVPAPTEAPKPGAGTPAAPPAGGTVAGTSPAFAAVKSKAD